ncbi:hypothetical protein F0562_012420 [Nyssa sinensis]|uniref:Homeobox domain-containing protein n=1 Tax=Nyssa sinensis TaxID=561372 RepID=A0A5J4ZXH6_9ASTE|nr:hypothetical protein F0562_012420 [Nyssa sinensis]
MAMAVTQHHRESSSDSINKHLDNEKYVWYTAEQVEALERVYAECPKPSSLLRQQLIRECPILSNIEPIFSSLAPLNSAASICGCLTSPKTCLSGVLSSSNGAWLPWTDLIHLENGTMLGTYVEGFSINITQSGDTLMLNEVAVLFPDMYYNDGLVVHGLRDILTVPERPGQEAGPSSEPARNYTQDVSASDRLKPLFSYLFSSL